MEKAKKSVKFLDKKKAKPKKKSIIEKLREENGQLKQTVETYKNQDVQKDINFLKNIVNQKELDVQILEEKIKNDQIGSQETVTQLKSKFSFVEKNLNDNLEETKKQNEILNFKVKSVEELELMNLNLMQQMNKLENELLMKDEQCQDKLMESQKQAVRDRLKIKEKVEEKLNIIADKFHHDVNRRITEEMRFVLQENFTLKEQLTNLEEDVTHLQKILHENKEKMQSEDFEIYELKKSNFERHKIEKELSEALKMLKENENRSEFLKLQKLKEKLDNDLKIREETINEYEIEIKEIKEERQNLVIKLKQREEQICLQNNFQIKIKGHVNQIMSVIHNTTKNLKLSTDIGSVPKPCRFCETRLLLYEKLSKLMNDMHDD